MRNDKINFLKFIDHWVGSPICILLSLLNRLFNLSYKRYLTIPSEYLPPRNILVIKFFGMGSIALASALITNIRQKYKNTKIIFLTFKDNLSVLEILSLADETLIIDTKNPFVLISSICRAIVYCHKQRIDIAMDIEFFSKFSTIMTFLSGARFRMGFYLARFWRDSLVNVPIYFNYNRNLLEIYGMFATALLIENPNLYPKQVIVSEEKKKEFLTFLKEMSDLDLNKTIGINIHASDLALCRRWPLPRFVALVEQFLSEYSQWNIIITGVKGESAYSQEFFELLPPQWHGRVIDLTGKINLNQFLTMLSLIPLYITNDTGPFHMAKAVGTRTISLWGPSSVDLYGPFDKEKELHDVIYKRYPCSPCVNLYRTNAGFFCGQKAPCMQSIEPLDVMTVINQRLNK